MNNTWKPAGYPSMSPYLISRDAEALIAFLKEAFGGVLLRRFDRPDGSLMHAELRIDDSMVMLNGYARIVEFFMSFDWWKTNPHDELVDKGAFCLADPGKTYAVYLPRGGKVTVKLAGGTYKANWFNPRDGGTKALPPANVPAWTSPDSPDAGDWALLLKKM